MSVVSYKTTLEDSSPDYHRCEEPGHLHKCIILKSVNDFALFTLHFAYRVYKGKAIPVRSWTDPEGSRRLRFQDFETIGTEGGKVVSLTHRPSLPPTLPSGNIPGTNFC